MYIASQSISERLRPCVTSLQPCQTVHLGRHASQAAVLKPFLVEAPVKYPACRCCPGCIHAAFITTLRICLYAMSCLPRSLLSRSSVASQTYSFLISPQKLRALPVQVDVRSAAVGGRRGDPRRQGSRSGAGALRNLWQNMWRNNGEGEAPAEGTPGYQVNLNACFIVYSSSASCRTQCVINATL